MTVIEDAQAGKYGLFRDFNVSVEEHAPKVAAMLETLKADLEAEQGLTEHPRKEQVWQMARQLAPSNDPLEIVRQYGEMAALVQPGAYRALKHLESVIREMTVLLDNGELPRVRNKLLALAGENPGYRTDIDAARELLANAVKK